MPKVLEGTGKNKGGVPKVNELEIALKNWGLTIKYSKNQTITS